MRAQWASSHTRCVHKVAFGRACHGVGRGVADLQQQKCTSQFWGLEAKNPGAGRTEFSLNALENDKGPFFLINW